MWMSFLIAALLLVSAAHGLGQEATVVGTTTAVLGDVLTFFPPDAPTGKVPRVKDSVFFRERVETREASRAKILFIDDTILSVGSNTRVIIDEHVFDPERNLRQATVSMGVGTLRVLVGKTFGGGSKFEVHTPTAVAGVRGSYFIVSVPSPDVTEIIVLEGVVAVRNILGAVTGEVAVTPNLRTRVELNAPPLPPTPVPGAVRETALAATVTVEPPPREAPPQGQDAVAATAKVVLPISEAKAEVTKVTRSEEIQAGIRPPDAASAPTAAPTAGTPTAASPATTSTTTTLSAIQPFVASISIAPSAAPTSTPVSIQGATGTVEAAVTQRTLPSEVQVSVGVPTTKVRVTLRFPGQ